MATSIRPREEELLEHTTWVRALAGSLVGDPHGADELAQETWVVALSKPPARRENLRGWLAAVVRNALRQDRRAALRRTEREARVARPEAAEEPDVLDRARTHRRLVEVVTELEQPFRTALLLRYFDGLGPREIAERLDVPLDTARSRLRRGLERMRTRLDAECGGDRSQWLGALAPLLPPPPPPPASPLGLGLGALAMNAKLKIALACAVALGGVWILKPESDAATPPTQAADPVADPAPSTASEGRPVETKAVSDARRPVDLAVADATPSPIQEAPADVVLLHGSVLDTSEQPVGGLALSVSSAGQRTAVQADRAGRFQLERPGSTTTIRSADGRYATLLAGEFQPDTPVDPVVVVAPAITLGGRVSDEVGRPIEGARVALDVPRDLQRRFEAVLVASTEQLFVTWTDAGGRFALEAVPAVAGAVLSSTHAGYTPDERGAPGTDDLALEIVLRPGVVELGAIQGRVVDATGAALAGAHVAAGLATTRSDLEGRFSFDLETSRSATGLVAVHAGLLPARAEPIATAQGSLWPDFLTLTLTDEPLSISGRVEDEDGAALAGVRLWISDPTLFGLDGTTPVQLENHLAGRRSMAEIEEAGESLSSTPNSFWSWTRTDEDGQFRFGGLMDRAYRFRLMDPTTVIHTTTEPVAAGASGVTLVLPSASSARTLTGSVRSPGGYPVAEARVGIYHRAWHAEVEGQSMAWDVEGPSTFTDSDGGFVLEGIPSAGVWLNVRGDGFLSLRVDPPELDGLEQLALEVELASDRCFFRVELANPERADRFELRGPDGEPAGLEFRRGGYATSSFDAGLEEGRSFVLGVPEGTYELVLFKDHAAVAREWVGLTPGEVTVLRP